MAPLTDTGNRATACILTEAAGHRSRDNIALKSGSGIIAPNTVLAKDGETYVPAAAAGTAVAIALYGGDTTDGDVFVAALTCDAEVNIHTLIFAPDVTTPAARATKIDQLRAVGIVAR